MRATALYADLINDVKLLLKQQNLRDYCLFVVGINSGLRISDLLQLTISDVINQGKIKERIRLREKKTNKFKDFPLSEKAKKAIKDYLNTRNYTENLFDENEINIYQNFAISLSDIISCVDKDIKYLEDIEIIQKKLSDLYRNVMLEESIPQNTSIIRCFLDGTYKFWPQREFKTSILKDFLKFFKGCSKDKKNIVLNNLHSRFDSINRIEGDLLSEEDVPF